MELLKAAIKAGKGAVDWYAATECAAWSDSRDVREACERASQPSDEDVQAEALAMIESGEVAVDEFSRLIDRANMVLTDAAARLIGKEAATDLANEEEEAFQARCKAADQRNAARDLIQSALGSRCEVRSAGYSGFGSIYLEFRGVQIRVSDHAQKPGGGFSIERQERLGESDISYVNETPTRKQVRRDVAAAIRRSR